MRPSLLVTSLALSLGLLVGDAAAAGPVRIKDIARPQGARHNQLVGYGLVVGLEGTGDSAQIAFTGQAVRNLVARLGSVLEPGARVRTRNAAVVVITADLPPFVRSGDRIDAAVSSLGDARSLQGGVLLQAPLLGADGRVYAVAQGSVSIGGFAAGGPGAQVTKNHPTVGRIPGGALVEAEVESEITVGDVLLLSLHRPDYQAAVAVARAIAQAAPGAEARAQDAGLVAVRVPEAYQGRAAEFYALLGELEVSLYPPARVVIVERTGTVVVGGPVTISPVAVAHGALRVEVGTRSEVSQPPPLSPGTTVVTPEVQLWAEEESAALLPVRGATVDDLVRCLNALQASPRDLIAILQAIKQAGALHAELELL